MGKIIHPELSFKVNGILFKTHNQLGRYYSEGQYADFVEKLLKESNIRYEREKYFHRYLMEKRLEEIK